MALQSYATPNDLSLYLRDVSVPSNTAVWTSLLDRASRFIDDQTGWFFYQLASTTYLINGNDSNFLIPPFPLISVSLLESQYYTGGPWNTISAGSYFLEPNPPTQGWPFTYIELTDIPSQGQAVKFWRGKQNVRITAVAGFPAIPSRIVDLCLKIASQRWRGRVEGFSGSTGAESVGISTLHSLDDDDWQTINDYKRPMGF